MLSSFMSRSCKLIAATAVVAVLCPGLCLAADFSADTTTKIGKTVMSGKLYASGSNWRQEFSSPQGKQISIGRGTVRYRLMPATKQYMQAPGIANPWSASSMVALYGGAMTRKSAGKQTVGGLSCDKYVYTTKQGPHATITQCVCKDLDLPVMTEVKSPNGVVTVEYKNIKKGTPPASLFQVPKGYKKVSMPAAPGLRGSARPAPPKTHK